MNRLILVGAAFLLSSFCVFDVVRAQTEQKITDRTVDSFVVESADVHVALQRLAQRFSIPIGLEMIPESKAIDSRKFFDIRLSNCRVLDVLEAIVTKDSRYQWSEKDGIINVFPRVYGDTILDVVVPEITLVDVNQYQVGSAIARSEAIVERANQLGIYERTISGYPYSNDPKLRKFSLQMQNATMRQILNRALELSGAYYWVVQIYGVKDNERNKYYMVHF